MQPYMSHLHWSTKLSQRWFNQGCWGSCSGRSTTSPEAALTRETFRMSNEEVAKRDGGSKLKCSNQLSRKRMQEDKVGPNCQKSSALSRKITHNRTKTRLPTSIIATIGLMISTITIVGTSSSCRGTMCTKHFGFERRKKREKTLDSTEVLRVKHNNIFYKLLYQDVSANVSILFK